MRLLRIEVKDLFDCYSYPIEMVEDRAITIIHAPNGYGKTTLLKLTKYALELKFAELYEIPFYEFELLLEGNVKIV